MADHKASNDLIELLIRPKYVALACDIYTASANDGVPEQFLKQPENLHVVAEVQRVFPGAVKFLGNRRLLEMVHKGCITKLRSNRDWRAFIRQDTRWPSIYITPRSAKCPYWLFQLQMDARDLPFTFTYGVAFAATDDDWGTGGRPTAMSKTLEREVERVGAEFKKIGFKVKPKRYNDWYVWDNCCKWCNVNYNPQLLEQISDGSLATEIAEEFLELVRRWAPEIKKLNKALRG